jgi:FAD/FMN-containing dehydrogenase
MDLTNAKSVTTDGPFKVAYDRGSFDGRVSSEWFSRPDDQKFTSLNELRDFTAASAAASNAEIIDVSTVRVVAHTEKADSLELQYVPRGRETETIAKPNHWSFGQVCGLTSVPAGYLRKLPAPIAGINLQYALQNFRAEAVKTYETTNGGTELRAVTGPDYGRIHDYEVVDAVQGIAGNGIGDTRWKVPGVMDWHTGMYNPNAPITRESTTLFASDRDVFLFLVDDKNPIEIGTLPSGEPDLIFRGFYTWNSEVGAKSCGIATFYLRGVCQNRCLWGVEGFQEFSLRHSKNAPGRFAQEAAPALETFANSNTNALLAGINSAREAKVAHDEDSRKEFLAKRGFTKTQTKEVIDTVLKEEGKQPESIWDFVQGITAVARKQGHQDARITMERQAGKLLDKVA